MHRTQISLEQEQYETLMREARRRGLSLAAVLREMIQERFAGARRPKAKGIEALKALGEGDGEAVGRRHNEFLYGRKRK